jgi:cytosine/adenosine deaminase-related metal-dependent hydrolase
MKGLVESGRVAIGTDSRLTGSQDLLDELRLAADQSCLSPRALVRLVTDRAADILQLCDRGRLTAGVRADCVIIRDASDPYAALLGTTRASVRAVVRNGAPVIADPDFAEWFAHAGVDAVRVVLDGRPKLLASTIIDSIEGRAACALEPGLTIGAVA